VRVRLEPLELTVAPHRLGVLGQLAVQVAPVEPVARGEMLFPLEPVPVEPVVRVGQAELEGTWAELVVPVVVVFPQAP